MVSQLDFITFCCRVGTLSDDMNLLKCVSFEITISDFVAACNVHGSRAVEGSVDALGLRKLARIQQSSDSTRV